MTLGSYILIDLVAKHRSGELICPATALIVRIESECQPFLSAGKSLKNTNVIKNNYRLNAFDVILGYIRQNSLVCIHVFHLPLIKSFDF